jgi:hypothetical protein
MKLEIVKGKTSKSIDVFIRDTSQTDGRGLTGLVFNTGSLVAYYHRPGSAAAAITLVTLASATAAWASGGFVAVDGTNMPGLYRLDVPDAVLATGVDEVVIMLRGAANMSVEPIEIQLVSYNPNDSVRMGLTALPNAAAEAAGGLFTRGTGAGQVNQDANGRLDVNLAAISTDAPAADNLESYCDGTTPIPANATQFGGTNGTFSAGRPEVNTTHFAGTAATSTGGIPSVNTIQWRGVQPNNLSSGRLDSTVGAMQADVVTAAAIAADAIGASELAADAATEIATAVGALVCETNGSRTLKQIQSITLAVLAGVTANGGNTLKDPERHLDARDRDDRRQQQPHDDGAQPERVVCGHPLLGPAVLGCQLLVQLLLGQPGQRCLGGYWSSSYWSNRYWQPHYWAGSAVPAQRGYWSSSYWSPHYWSSQYWPQAYVPPLQGAYWGEGYWNRDYWGADYFSFPVHLGDGSALGTIQSTLGGLGASVFGSVINPGFYPGVLSATFDALSATLSGIAYRALPFDVSMFVGPSFIIREFPGFEAQIDTTLGDVASVLSGTFLPVGSINGSAAIALADLAFTGAGSSVGPPARLGAIDSTLGGIQSAIAGITFLPGARLGSIDAILDALAGDLAGTSGLSPRDGVIAVSLDDLAGLVVALSLPAGTRLGVISPTFDDLVAAISGTRGVGDASRAHFTARREKLKFEAARQRVRFEVQR